MQTHILIFSRYNMPVYGNAGTYNVQINPFAQHQQSDGIIYKPLYSLQGHFEETCDAWINYTVCPLRLQIHIYSLILTHSQGPVNTRYDWIMQNVNGHDWSSLGHSTSVTNSMLPLTKYPSPYSFFDPCPLKSIVSSQISLLPITLSICHTARG
jgi:hypothetical protein